MKNSGWKLLLCFAQREISLSLSLSCCPSRDKSVTGTRVIFTSAKVAGGVIEGRIVFKDP